MENMRIATDSLIKWERLAQRKCTYVDGEETFDNALFKDAMKLSFDMVCLLTKEKTLPVCRRNVSGSPYFCVLDWCKVLQYMTEYATDCFEEDESKDLIFTASRFAVRMLLNKTIWSSSFSGDPVLTDDMEFCDDERYYSYNVETGDLSDLQKLAQYRASWD